MGPFTTLGPWRRRRWLRRELRRHVKEHIGRLNARLNPMGLAQVPMKDDGNCQFRALSHQLYGTPDCHHAVRTMLVDFMRSHPEDFAVYFDSTTDFNDYLDSMTRPGEWGDELTLRAACNCFGIDVHVVTSAAREVNWLLKYSAGTAAGSHRTCVLSYVEPIHYNSVVPARVAMFGVA